MFRTNETRIPPSTASLYVACRWFIKTCGNSKNNEENEAFCDHRVDRGVKLKPGDNSMKNVSRGREKGDYSAG